MYLVENNKISTDIEIEFIVLPDNYRDTATPSFFRYKDYCQLKLKFLSGNSVMNIMSTIMQFAQIIHSSGHVNNDVCYKIKFNITWKDMPENIKEKLEYKSIDELNNFFGIDQNKLYSDSKNIIQDIMNKINFFSNN